jgi:paraquat-inducible protein B
MPSLVWLIPIVAALIGGYLALTSYLNQGPQIVVSFRAASGVEAGKTHVRYKDVVVGVVEDVELSDDLGQINVTIRMNKSFARHVSDDTRFWVVMPRVGASGVSGLETLLSGVYIGIDPGKGDKPATTFAGLNEPPLIQSDDPGVSLELRSDSLGGLSRGSPIYFRGIQVGRILAYRLSEDNKTIVFTAFVDAPYDEFVRQDSRFWNASGLSVAATNSGIKLQVESLQTLLVGGVNFDAPSGTTGSTKAENGAQYQLFGSFEDVTSAGYAERIQAVAYFGGSVRGLKPGAAVDIRGIQIGTVESVALEFDPSIRDFRVKVVMQFEPERARPQGTAIIDGTPIERAQALIQAGLRAQLRTASLLTGDLYVAVDFFPNEPKAAANMIDGMPELPTVPTAIDQLQTSATTVLNKISAMPIDEIARNVNQVVENLNSLVAAPELKAALASVGSVAEQLKSLSDQLGRDIGPVTADLKRTLSEAASAMAAAERTFQATQSIVAPDSRLRLDLASALKEFAAAARSIRTLTDYLERNPDALIRGKGPATR